MKSPPTKKKIDKARREGKFVKSQLLTKSAVTATVILLSLFLLPEIWVRNRILLEYVWVFGGKSPLEVAIACSKAVFGFSAIFLAGAAVVSVVCEIVQVGIVWQPDLLAPRGARMSPAEGIKKLCTGIRQLWLTALKGFTLAFLLFLVTRGVVNDVGQDLALNGGASLLSLTGRILFRFLLWSAAGLTFCGVLEYVVNRRRYYKELEMTPEELKREYKDEEGDPHLKARRRALHHELAVQAIKDQVRRSKVIIVERA